MRKVSILLLVAVVVVGGCGKYTYKAAYNNLDFILMNEIDSYFNVTDTQKTILKKNIAEQLFWHRTIVLPRYISILERISKGISAGFTENEIIEISGIVRMEYKLLVEHIADDAADFLLSLNDDQIIYFQNKLKDYNKKEEEKRKENASENSLKHAEHFVNSLEYFYGDFNDLQIAKIAKLLPDNSGQKNNHSAYLRETQQLFLTLLKKKADRAELKRFLIGWMTRDTEIIKSRYLHKPDGSPNKTIHALAEIDRTIVVKNQRIEGVQRINDIINTLNDLHENR